MLSVYRLMTGVLIVVFLHSKSNTLSVLRTIYTIGHSTRSIADFIAILQSFHIQVLADIRSMPGSKWQPQFNQSALDRSLKEAGIKYIHIPDLGGKRKHIPSINEDAASNKIPGYGTYMKTEQFWSGIEELESLARLEKVAYMCAEADWRHCHRSLVSDYLHTRSWEVLHIMSIGKSMPHTPTQPQQIQGNLFS
ncbi:MAG: hypothetical protein JWQ38_3041 [Flavipsychrobacter sp.]|nr:hypothetical protein [Flavipsychrobacter sp.]